MNKVKAPTKKLPNKLERHQLFGSVSPGPRIKPTEKNGMADLQNTKKDFLFDLDQVGIANVKHPITIKSNLTPTTQTSIGTFQFTSKIGKMNKGTNMSRFTEQLAIYAQDGFSTDIETLQSFTKDLAKRLGKTDACITISFPWFFERSGPQSAIAGLHHADCKVSINYDQAYGFHKQVSLIVPVTTLCPCSKEISEYGAHNQRGYVTMEVDLTKDFDDKHLDWKEMLLDAAETNASARLHPILKRPDEKLVTEHAYENPRFVEDMVRLVAADLYEMPFVQKFHVSCRNEESIHMHDAIASITFDKLNPSF